MSCRIVRHGQGQEQVQVTPWPAGRSSTAGGAERAVSKARPERAADQGHANEADHLRPLHARIMELEAALQVDVQSAREAAYQEGVQSGREQARKEIEPTVERMAKVLADLAGLRMRLRRDAEADLVQLALSIARRILRRELSVDPDAIAALVKSAMEKMQSRELARVRVHPEQEGALRRSLEKLGAGSLEILADNSLRSGDLIFETRRGDLDASIETQLSEIERGFADRIGK
jgi:flagellar assembly protein FliH